MSIKFFIVCCLCIAFIWIPCFASDDSFEQQEELALEISMQRFDLMAKEIIIRLDVINIGKHSLILPHLREGLLEQYAVWAGWVLHVKKCYPYAFFLHHFARHPELRQEDMIELEPGEHFSVTINLANMRPHHSYQRYGEELSPLISVDGEYEIAVGFNFPEEDIPLYLRNIVWKGVSKSNTIRFMITHEKRRMYFPGEQSQITSPNGQYVIINSDSESDAHMLSQEGGGILYLHNTKTGGQEKMYIYNEHVEVLWSPKGSRVLINDYGCSNNNYYSFPLIFFMNRKESINIKEQLQQKMGDNFSQRADIMGAKWLNENGLEVRIFDYGAGDHHKFMQRYEYHVIEGIFRKLE